MAAAHGIDVSQSVFKSTLSVAHFIKLVISAVVQKSL